MVPPERIELSSPAPEAGTLSTELQGHIKNITATRSPTSVLNLTPRAIAYEITTPSLLRKQESRACNLPGFRNETANFGHWIPAFAGMTVKGGNDGA